MIKRGGVAAMNEMATTFKLARKTGDSYVGDAEDFVYEYYDGAERNEILDSIDKYPKMFERTFRSKLERGWDKEHTKNRIKQMQERIKEKERDQEDR